MSLCTTRTSNDRFSSHSSHMSLVHFPQTPNAVSNSHPPPRLRRCRSPPRQFPFLSRANRASLPLGHVATPSMPPSLPRSSLPH
jgi:hypothetical protein